MADNSDGIGGNGGYLAITNGRVFPVSGPVIEKGTVLIKGSKIAAVGAAAEVDIPVGARVVDAAGKVVMPGIVEAHCHLSVFDWGEDAGIMDDLSELNDGIDLRGLGDLGGLSDRSALAGGGGDPEDLVDREGGNESPGGRGGAGDGGMGMLPPATTPDWDYYYAFNPKSDQLKAAVAGGVTTILTRPGSGKVITGIDLVTKTAGKSRKDMVILHPAGVKMAFGENAKRNFGSRGMMPSTRMGIAAMLREALVKAQNYQQRWEEYEKRKAEFEAKMAAGGGGAPGGALDGAPKSPRGGADNRPPEPPPRNFQMEALVKVLKRELPARIHAHRADDIMTVIRIGDEFGIEFSLEHATETHRILDEVKKRNIPCVVGPTYGARGKIETRGKTFATPGILEHEGIKCCITTDASVVPIEYLRTCASLAYREGMSEAGAIAAITLWSAEIAKVADRVGSLDAGKDADVVILSGHPLQVTSRVEKVFIDGREVYDVETNKEEWEK